MLVSGCGLTWRDRVPAFSHTQQLFFRFADRILLTVCVTLAAFAHLIRQAVQPGVVATLQVTDQACSWVAEAKKLNPFGCLQLRLEVSAVASTGRPLGSTCRGPLVEALFAAYSGGSGELDYMGAVRMARAVEQRLGSSAACGQQEAGRAKPHVCFNHATTGRAVGADGAGRFAWCLVAHEPAECRAGICK